MLVQGKKKKNPPIYQYFCSRKGLGEVILSHISAGISNPLAIKAEKRNDSAKY
jgi:hypothetical protein